MGLTQVMTLSREDAQVVQTIFYEHLLSLCEHLPIVYAGSEHLRRRSPSREGAHLMGSGHLLTEGPKAPRTDRS